MKIDKGMVGQSRRPYVTPSFTVKGDIGSLTQVPSNTVLDQICGTATDNPHCGNGPPGLDRLS
jgi:hypothetical protein